MDISETEDLIGYRPYTREFDIVTDITNVIEPQRLSELEDRLGKYRAKWQNTDALTSLVDRLPSIFEQALEAAGSTADDTTVLFLVDGSGSTRGATALHIAAATIEACLALEEIGVETTVLGYSTTTWKGGLSRMRWLEDGKPRDPGRLCDLLHIVYKTPDTEVANSMDRLCAMVAEETKKENVDGEALLWAVDCTETLDRPHKIVVNITDGFFPVDDSTLYSNSTNPLTMHMVTVCEAIEQNGTIALSRVYVDLDDAHLQARQHLLDGGMTNFRRDVLTTEMRDMVATFDAIVHGVELGISRTAELSVDLDEDHSPRPGV